MATGDRRRYVALWVAIGLALAVVVIVVIAAGSGGDDDSDQSAQEWAAEVCGDVHTWYEEVVSIEGFFDGVGPGTGGLTGEIEQRVDEIGAATQRLVEEIEAVGLPDTEAGREAEAIVRDLAASLERRVERVDEAVERASDGGLSATFTAITTALDEIDEGRTEIEHAVDRLRDLDPAGEIEQALEDAPACEDLRAAVSG